MPPASGTRREGSVSGSLVRLPVELAGDFEVVKELASGGEGYVLLVEAVAGGRYVVKLYFKGLAFDEAASRLLAEADAAHVVRFERPPGVASENGARFEVLEWCESGSLRDVMVAGGGLDVLAVVGELSGALEHIHGLRLPDDPDARLVHQDVKPENVLVRSLVPELDLVLGDFGLARMIAGSRHYTNRQQGSRPYAPPLGEAVSPAWDWWSAGMLVAELAGGRHPFVVDGQFLSDAAISDRLSQGPVDLSAVADPRVQLLCSGLLTRRTADRWGGAQVREWLAGGSPRVAADAGATGRRARKVFFADVEYIEPVELALAFQQEWDQALEQVAQRTDQNLVTDLRLFLNATGMSDAVAVLDDTALSPPTRLAKLLVEMNPDLPPIVNGRDVRPAALLAALQRSGTVSTITFVETQVLDAAIFTVWRDLEGMDDAVNAQRRLTQARSTLKANTSALDGLSEPERLQVRTTVYCAAIADDPDGVRRAFDKLGDTTKAARQSWWQDLAKQTDNPYALTIATLTKDLAAQQTTTQDQTRERDERERRESERAQQRAVARTRTVRRTHPSRLLGLVVGLLILATSFPKTRAHIPRLSGSWSAATDLLPSTSAPWPLSSSYTSGVMRAAAVGGKLAIVAAIVSVLMSLLARASRWQVVAHNAAMFVGMIIVIAADADASFRPPAQAFVGVGVIAALAALATVVALGAASAGGRDVTLSSVLIAIPIGVFVWWLLCLAVAAILGVALWITGASADDNIPLFIAGYALAALAVLGWGISRVM